MTSRTLRIWYLVHKWTSLICTVRGRGYTVAGRP